MATDKTDNSILDLYRQKAALEKRVQQIQMEFAEVQQQWARISNAIEKAEAALMESSDEAQQNRQNRRKPGRLQ